MADQREHGVGGLEWRDQPARTPDEPLVPSTGAMGAPDDATTVFPAVRGEDGGAGYDRAGDSDSPDSTDRTNAGADTRRFGVLPTPTGWSDGTEQDGPVDLSAVHSDDALLSALVSFDNSMTGPDQDPELKSLLLSWRLDVDAEPIGELVDADTAMATIAVGAKLRRRRPRYLVPLATAAAALVIMVTGMGLAARNAVPGDALWGISQVLYTDHAKSVEAAALVRNDLHYASQALQQGHFDEARSALVQAGASLPSVDTADGKANLQAQQQNLLIQLDSTTLTTQPSTPQQGNPGAPTTAAPPSSSVDSATAPSSPQSPDTTTDNPPPTTTDEPPPTTTEDTPPPDTGSTGTAGDAPQQPNQPPAGNAPQDQPVLNPATPDASSTDAGATSAAN
ncbi:MAG TPA: anti-sigma-D factor RsdA [Pseudonocardiaceae bacterium]|nr:anti-sigma-D factor RsdA [Pseudonocardiaceae bacterium]